MNISQIAALGILGAALSLTLKKMSPEIALIVSIVTGVFILMGIFGQLSLAVGVLKDLSSNAGINKEYITVILKVLGIAYIAQFGMELCKDAGEGAIASKIELAGKVLIIAVSLPVITGVVEVITSILP